MFVFMAPFLIINNGCSLTNVYVSQFYTLKIDLYYEKRKYLLFFAISSNVFLSLLLGQGYSTAIKTNPLTWHLDRIGKISIYSHTIVTHNNLLTITQDREHRIKKIIQCWMCWDMKHRPNIGTRWVARLSPFF